MRRQQKHWHSGSTFMSVLIAIVVMSAAAVPLLTTLIDQTRATKMSKMRVFANQLACNIIERFRTEKFSEVASFLDSPESGEIFISEDPLLNPEDMNPGYQSLMARYNRLVVLTPITDRKGILDVVVSWTEDGRGREVRMSTVLVDANFDGGKPM